MYVIKVGDYYIENVDTLFGGYIKSIKLSKEKMRTFTKEGAGRIAKMVNGIVEEVTNE